MIILYNAEKNILVVILVPENNGKQNPEESYTNKYQKHIACSYGYKLVYINDSLVSLLRHT